MNNDWRYRYSASGEREQKRKYPLDTNEHLSSDGNPWVYYLLGGGKEQLAVWHGQERWDPNAPQCPIGRVLMYPVEYNSYAGGLARLTTRPQLPGTPPLKEYHIADHLGSVRVVIDSLVRGITTDYEPFGAIAYTTSFGLPFPSRQTFIDKEKDGENGLGDFGVRKYEEETGRFMSVDALWEVYPSLTPFSYAANSPLLLKDPSGAVLVINGPDAEAVVAALNQDGSLALSRDSATGHISATGKPGSAMETAMLAAINDPNIEVALDATNRDYVEIGPGTYAGFIVGMFGGSTIGPSGQVSASQTVNLAHANSVASVGGGTASSSIMHEIIEAHTAAINSPGAMGTDVGVYLAAHNYAASLESASRPWTPDYSRSGSIVSARIHPSPPYALIELWKLDISFTPPKKVR